LIRSIDYNIHQGKTSIQGHYALYEKLRAGNKVALEAGKLAFIMEQKGCGMCRLNSAKLPFIWDAPTKTDRSDLRSADAIKLAHLVEERHDERLPLVPLPSEKGKCVSPREAPTKSRCRDLVGATYPFLLNEVKQKQREALNFLLNQRFPLRNR